MFSIDSSRIAQATPDIAVFAPFSRLTRRVAAALRALATPDEALESVKPGDLVSHEEIRFILDEWRRSAA